MTRSLMQPYYHACSTLLVLLTSCATANEPSSIYKCQPLELARSVASIELTEYLKEQYPEEQIRYVEMLFSDEDSVYRFKFLGSEEYARPGYYWDVYVKKRSCAGSIEPGK